MIHSSMYRTHNTIINMLPHLIDRGVVNKHQLAMGLFSIDQHYYEKHDTYLIGDEYVETKAGHMGKVFDFFWTASIFLNNNPLFLKLRPLFPDEHLFHYIEKFKNSFVIKNNEISCSEFIVRDVLEKDVECIMDEVLRM